VSKGIARRYRDPIYGYIAIPDELIDLVDSPIVTRLRRISQNGCGYVAYPSLTGNRYEHALGVMHLAMRAWDRAWVNSTLQNRQLLAGEVYKDIAAYGKDDHFENFLAQNAKAPHEAWGRDFAERMRVCVGAAALLHDVGHGPYSHTLEPEFEAFKERIFSATTLAQFGVISTQSPELQFHEVCGLVLSDLALESAGSKLSSWLTRQIIHGARKDVREKHQWASAIHRIISSPIDADRLDYLVRDSSRAGTEFGAMDVDRIIESMSIELRSEPVAEWIVAFGSHAVSAVESLLTNRERAYRWVYFHASALAADTALRRVVHSIFADDRIDLTQFDYVSNWGAVHRYGGSEWVDDAAVVRFLSGALRSQELGDETARIAALYRVAVDGDRATIAAWRNYEEYIAATGSKDYAWELQVHKQARDANHELGKDDPERSYVAGEVQTAADFGLLARVRLESHPDAELQIESNLNRLHPNVGGMAGTWMVTHRFRFSVRSSQISMWHRRSMVELERLSPIALGLDQADTMRLKLWAFFIPLDRDAFDKTIRATIGAAIADIFLSEIIDPPDDDAPNSVTADAIEGK
jgi:HD superfamily phosphohydrolase